ncbi:hypothetical protein [Bifidobacterium eulemuris]|uniref:Oligosaccharide repeat unit polymerase Wzy n=1 Tax=Bifidobacterium eulemuris TaxID=1765219 RepID=A0A261GC34_9BIFI|nr:hypothetical protein [Bifidobacterium eulemuris]OZG68536.1 oligosaccharide repeat unit polymerase Wzy [Bifidobacterium eulemuris]QOL32666.1 hypothetical protein BE0216_09635 [Bifidobacterium eulemuris]
MSKIFLSEKSNPSVNALVFLLALSFSDSLFGLVNDDTFNIASIVNASFIGQVGLLFFSTYLYFRNCKVKIYVNYLNILILLLIAMCFFAAFRSFQLTGQPFLRGILPQRGFVICLICALLLKRPIANQMIDVKKIIDGIIIIGTIVSFLYFLQAFSGVQLFQVMSNERYGSVRLYIKNCFCDLAGIFAFWKLCNTGILRYLLPSTLTIALCILVSKSRLELISLIAVYIFIFCIAKCRADYKFLLLILFILVACLFLSTNYGQTLLANFNPITAEDTSSIRDEGKALYANQLNSSTVSWLFGCGYPSSIYYPAYVRSGMDRGFLLVDNGISAFTYVYGHVGLMLIICVFLFMLRQCIRRSNETNRVYCLAFLIFNLVLSSNITWWWTSSSWQVVMAFFVAFSAADPINKGVQHV